MVLSMHGEWFDDGILLVRGKLTNTSNKHELQVDYDLNWLEVLPYNHIDKIQ